jgi:hypothetical protein
MLWMCELWCAEQEKEIVWWKCDDEVSRGEGLRDKLAFTGDFEERFDQPHDSSPWHIRSIARIHQFCL